MSTAVDHPPVNRASQQGPAIAASRLRVLFALPGLHRVNRGAEVAFESVAAQLALRGLCEVTVAGSGEELPGCPYRFLHAGCTPRERFERWPRMPVFRGDCQYEEATFAARLWREYQPEEFDLTVTSGYPFLNWLLRGVGGKRRPRHVYVTQNGDWAPRGVNREYRYFSCDGLICTNPEYYEANRRRWPSVLIPNGVDPEVYSPGPSCREAFGLPEHVPVALMVSALIRSKRVLEAIPCVARVPGLHLAVAGDGPLRDQVAAEGKRQLGERFHSLKVERSRMPDLYRSADVFLHMSIDEPSANVYIEALASGMRIVTHDRAVTRWTFERAATLVDTTDEEAVAQGLRTALSLDRAGAGAMGRELVLRRFTWSSIAERYQEFFDAVCRGTVRPDA